MLEVERIDLSMLAQALEDHSYEGTWWFDPHTGSTEYHSGFEDGDDLPPDNVIQVCPVESSEAYADMEDFVGQVRDPKAREILDRALRGRGAFRRFKDALLEFPELRTGWFAFHDARAERRALQWLVDEEILPREVVEKEIESRPVPDVPLVGGAFDPVEVARAVTEDLRGLYGDRLKQALLFGSWARGDAHPESDIDLLIVLDCIGNPWDELRRMEPIVWRHSFENDCVVSVIPVSENDLSEAAVPLLQRVRAESRRIA